MMGRQLALVKEVYFEFSRARGPSLAATLSYYSLFSLFPIVILLVTVASYVYALPQVKSAVLELLDEVLPAFSPAVGRNLDSVIDSRGPVTIADIVVLLWSGTAVFSATEFALNQIWHVKTARNILLSKLFGLAFMCILAVLLVLSLLFSYLLVIVIQLADLLGIATSVSLLWRLGSPLIGLMLTATVFFFVYKFIPNRALTWREIWLGTVIGASSLEVAKFVFAWYIGRLARFNLVYGSMWGIIGLLTWFYISALILLLAAEIDFVRNNRASEADRTSNEG